jgi:hypothetical protein
LTLLARFRFLTRSQLQAFLFDNLDNHAPLSKRVMTARCLNSLVRKDLASRTARNVGGPTGGSGAYAYHLTAPGIRSLDDRRFRHLPRRLPPRGTFLLRHALATAEVALAFERAARDNEDHSLLSFECDWEAAQRSGSSIVVPDAYLVYASRLTELHAFVEVDLGTAGSKFFARKIAAYLALYRSGRWREASDIWPTVLVITPTERRAELLKHATETLLSAQPDSKQLERATEFAFAALPGLKDEGPLAAVWSVAGRTGKQPLLDGRPL